MPLQSIGTPKFMNHRNRRDKRLRCGYFEGDDTPHEINRTDSGYGRFAGFAAG